MKTKTLIIGTVVGTAIMFLWGATEWFNPMMNQPYKSVLDADEVNSTLLRNMPEDGMYVWPNGPKTKDENGLPKDIVYFMAKNEKSYYRPSRFMIIQLFTQLGIWFLITYLMMYTRIVKHWARVKLVLLAGLLSGFSFYIPMWNWWGFSTEYILVRFASMIVGWFLAGATISYLLRNNFVQLNNQQYGLKTETNA